MLTTRFDTGNIEPLCLPSYFLHSDTPIVRRFLQTVESPILKEGECIEISRLDCGDDAWSYRNGYVDQELIDDNA